jgi:hypothetical protein
MPIFKPRTIAQSILDLKSLPVIDKATVFPAYFCNEDSNYKRHGHFDVWTLERDALNSRSELPAVYHPPCAQWGRLRGLSRRNDYAKGLALWALHSVQLHGGILEHPRSSRLWDYLEVNAFKNYDSHGGFLCSLDLSWFGFPARKKTCIYVVGIKRSNLKAFPITFDAPTKIVSSSGDKKPELAKSQRSASPPAFCDYVYDVLNLIHFQKVLNDNYSNLHHFP